MARFKTLWEGYMAGTLTEVELREFLQLLHVEDAPLTNAVDELLESNALKGMATPGEKELIYQRILQRTQHRRIRSLGRWAAAAAMLLLIAAGTYLWMRPAPENNVVSVPEQVVKPGSNKATLILADGSSITLDSTGKQVLQQGNTAVQQNGGQLVYNVQGRSSTISYNTLNTPRGGQFQLQLPDGSKVWLNAASSLRYPTVFNGRERVVEIAGEAYFEIAKNAAMPFRVKIAGGAEVEVLGTSFNINAYRDEPATKTTLIEGSVRLHAQHGVMKLAPGQQGAVNVSGDVQLIKDANIEQAIAWKKGLFNFNKIDLEEAMKQLSRWYDVEVVYENGIPSKKFGGEVQRSLNLSDVLEILKLTDVHFRIENNRIIVTQ